MQSSELCIITKTSSWLGLFRLDGSGIRKHELIDHGLIWSCLITQIPWSYLASLVFERVPARYWNRRTIAEVLINNIWTHDIQGNISLEGATKLFCLWDCLMNIALNDQDDQHTWRLDASGCYSAKSAYKAYFSGAITFEPWRRL